MSDNTNFMNRIRDTPFNRRYPPSTTRKDQNLEHLPNIFDNLALLYAARDWTRLIAAQREDDIEVYCLYALHTLVDGALAKPLRTIYHMQA